MRKARVGLPARTSISEYTEAAGLPGSSLSWFLPALRLPQSVPFTDFILCLPTVAIAKNPSALL
ncbi:hypothetical protein [Sphingobacterium siyangense]|uniref:hypothetical protein n=1 Tax=Sphingobacterium siyangense TaxID=459529 RepID=UPI00301862D3